MDDAMHQPEYTHLVFPNTDVVPLIDVSISNSQRPHGAEDNLGSCSPVKRRSWKVNREVGIPQILVSIQDLE